MTRLVAATLILVGPLAAAEPKEGVTGYWLGTLHAGAIELRLGFHITSNGDSKLTATLDSVDQGARNIPFDSATFRDGTLTLKLAKAKFTYIGRLEPDGNTIKGELDQGVKFSLDVKRRDRPLELVRPQAPKKPYPYVEEEVTFPSRAKGVKLAGTFTKPKGEGPFPTVVFISGSGPQDRDESLMGHKPFLVLADYLTRQGIAVLRYDDRGVGKSTGDLADATTKDFAEDTAGAVAYLKGRKDVGKIGLLGHSEGGIIAPMVAAGNPEIAFIVLLAGTGTPGDRVLVAQSSALAAAMGAEEKDLARQRDLQSRFVAAAKAGADEEKLIALLAEVEKDLTDEEKKEFAKVREQVNSQLGTITRSWFRFFLNHDPRPMLRAVKCPVLALIGERDLQVPPKENLPEIEKAVKAGGNTDVTVKELPGLNHLFQTSKTGLPSEYGKIEETFAPAAMKMIAEWIQKRK